MDLGRALRDTHRVVAVSSLRFNEAHMVATSLCFTAGVRSMYQKLIKGEVRFPRGEAWFWVFARNPLGVQ